MKRKAKDTDGIWQEVRYKPETNADFLLLFDKVNPRTAADFMGPLISNTIQVLENRDSPKKSKEDAENVMFYFEQLKEHLDALVRDVDVSLNHRVQQAVMCAIHLGRFYEVMCVRPCESKVVRVNSTTRKLRQGFAREKAHKPTDIDAAIRLFNQLMLTKPAPKKTVAYRKVESQTGIPQRTLRYYLKKRREADA